MSQDEERIKQLWGELVVQSWKDETLGQRLLEEPAAVLKENGVEVPEGVTIKAFEDDGNTIIFPVAHKPADSELSDEDLESVAGGKLGYIQPYKSFGSFSRLKISSTGDDGSKGFTWDPLG